MPDAGVMPLRIQTLRWPAPAGAQTGGPYGLPAPLRQFARAPRATGSPQYGL